MSGVASAQLVSVGAIGGVPITDSTGRTDELLPALIVLAAICRHGLCIPNDRRQ
ncbi:MAG TPA: hypothetical protein VHZ74_05475 [Bryobacteraceae bacterium]|nr:hypothetical protein [Bryobacteraceae bacterium]